MLTQYCIPGLCVSKWTHSKHFLCTWYGQAGCGVQCVLVFLFKFLFDVISADSHLLQHFLADLVL